MTPKVQVSLLSAQGVAEHEDEASADANADADSCEDEPLPPHTSEIGTLKKLPNHATAWLGSSSGVYFVNTVRRAFSAAFGSSNNEPALPASEDILTGDDAEGHNYNGPVTEKPTGENGEYQTIVRALGSPPQDRKLAMDLVTTFFRCWHPLFPFLHGPQFLSDMDYIYKSGNHFGSTPNTTQARHEPADPLRTRSELRKLIIFQIVINLASLDRSDIHLPLYSRIKSTSDVTQLAGCISIRHDTDTIQACLAAELYLVATICLRQASTVAGIILKLIYHAGLHRCPLRYAQLSLEDCEIRKRIFWSAYALDRYLSLSLGDPNTVQDSDIDVCLSGKELHKAVARDLLLDPSDEFKMHLPSVQAGVASSPSSSSRSHDPRAFNMNNGPQAREKQLREAAMTAYVHYGKLTGRIIEIFHKSIHARFPKKEAITFLNSDIEKWWNQLPSSLTGDEGEPGNQDASSHHRHLEPFFLVLYQQLLLLLNRPRLSLDQSTAEFQHGLQICLRASRNSISALKRHKDNGQSMLLPGLFSAAWMAGLIIAFACQLGKYPKSRACSDISACLSTLESGGCGKWFTLKNCHKVLSLLLQNIQGRKASADGFLSAVRPDGLLPRPDHTANNPRKRAYVPDDDLDTESSPKGNSASERSPATSRPPFPRHPVNLSTSESSSPSRRADIPDLNSTTSNNQENNPAIHQDWKQCPPSACLEDDPFSKNSFSSTFNNSAANTAGTFESAMYYDPQDAAFAQSNHDSNPHLPDTQFEQTTDPLFWDNFEYNIPDIFGAVSWENMTGTGGPMSNTGSGSFWNEFGFGANSGSST